MSQDESFALIYVGDCLKGTLPDVLGLSVLGYHSIFLIFGILEAADSWRDLSQGLKHAGQVQKASSWID